MKKEIPPALMIAGVVLLLIVLTSFGYKALNPPQELRGGGEAPKAMPQRQPGAPQGGKPAMSAAPGAGDYTK